MIIQILKSRIQNQKDETVNIRLQVQRQRNMLKQYYSVNQYWGDRWVGQNRNSTRAESKRKLVSDKSSIINERVQKIRSKYGAPISMKQNILCNQSMCLLANQGQQNKQNQSAMLNISVIDPHQEQAKYTDKDPKPKKQKKSTRQSSRVRELEQINMKISKLIQTLKCEEGSQAKQENQQFSQPPTYHPSIRERSKYFLNSTKLSLDQLKRSRMKTQSLECSHKSNRSSSSRENGKITKGRSATKSVKDLSRPSNQMTKFQYHPEKLVKELCIQLEYDQKYMKQKTTLMKTSKNFKSLLEFAVKRTNLSEDERQIILEWNFQDIDPLYTQRNSSAQSGSIDENEAVYFTIDCFLKSQDHWKRKIFKKFNVKELNFSDLDAEQKGYFLKEDFTRFLSLKSKKMLCNRDINIIFRRINRKKNKIVPMQEIIKTFCQ